jgi:hypothetical protein
MELHPYYKDVVTYESKSKLAKTDTEKERVDYYLKQYKDLFKK